jgi:hypothetical protein
MKEGLHDPAALRRVVEILRALGLDEDATEASAYLASRDRGPR